MLAEFSWVACEGEFADELINELLNISAEKYDELLLEIRASRENINRKKVKKVVKKVKVFMALSKVR